MAFDHKVRRAILIAVIFALIAINSAAIIQLQEHVFGDAGKADHGTMHDLAKDLAEMHRVIESIQVSH